MIPAALYARVSSARQKQHETIDSQVTCLREHARKQGWEVPEEWVFTDDGWSGSTLVRPALERLRDLSAQRLVDRVLCLAPDRLARTFAHQVLLVEEFTRNGAEVVFLRNPEAATPEQALLVQVQGVIAEYERAQIAERTRRGKLHRARAGQASVLGRAPYGYRYLSKAEHGAAAYAVDQAEAGVVARIFHRYAAGGISMRALARELTRDRIPSPQGRPEWDAGTLGRMLRNPAYMGRACFGKTQTAPAPPRPNRTSRLAGRAVPAQAGVTARPRQEWIEIPVPALVSEEVFALVERRLAENAKFSPRNTKEPALLQGLLVCDICGYSYTRTSQGPGPKKYHYYRCPGTNGWELPQGRRVCSSRPLRADDLDQLVWEHMVVLLADPALVRAELEHRLAQMRDADPVRARQERLHRQIATVDAAINRLIGAYQEDLITRDELRERVPALRAQRQNLHGRLEALAAQLVDQQTYLKLADNLESFLARLRESARTTSVIERQRVLRAVVKEVRIGAGRITIRHSIPSTSPDPTPGYLLRRGRASHRDLRRPQRERDHRCGHPGLQWRQPGPARHPHPAQAAPTALSRCWVCECLMARRGVVGAGFRAGAQASAGWPAAPVIWSRMVKRMVISAR
ncbi:recombinase family protein [Streptomyces chlorus]|uniref:Recombinase family protein n=1 Tax=Streptomyces chlorus TaxID=887452 RepID=A0ABW1E7Y8_9ACTN